MARRVARARIRNIRDRQRLTLHPIITGTLYARDLATGQELWRAELGGTLGAGPSVADGRVYVSNGMSAFPSAPEGGFVSSLGLAEGAGQDAPKLVQVEPVAEPARV